MEKFYSLAAVGVLLTLGACSNDDDLPPPPAPTPPAQPSAQLQVIHASPNAPAVNVLVDGAVAVPEAGYGDASGVLSLPPGSYSVRVDAILPDDTTSTVIGPVDLDLAADVRYSAIAVGLVGGSGDQALGAEVLERDDAFPMAGMARVGVLHAAPQAGTVDIYLTAPGEPLDQAVPLVTAGFRDSVPATEIPAGSYQIRVTAPGVTASTVFDSGPIVLRDGADYQLNAIENNNQGGAPIALLTERRVQTPAIGNEVVTIYDVAEPANLQIVHASPDAPAVDIVVNGDFANPLLTDLAYKETSGILEVPAGTYEVAIAPTGTMNSVLDAELTVESGGNYTVLAVNTLAAGLEVLVAADETERVATEASARVIHASPGAMNVDIYATAVGAGIDMAEPLLTDVPFKANTGYLSLAEGTYDITVTPTGTKTPAIGPAPFTLSNEGVYTIIAVDPEPGDMDFGVIGLDDLTP